MSINPKPKLCRNFGRNPKIQEVFVAAPLFNLWDGRFGDLDEDGLCQLVLLCLLLQLEDRNNVRENTGCTIIFPRSAVTFIWIINTRSKDACITNIKNKVRYQHETFFECWFISLQTTLTRSHILTQNWSILSRYIRLSKVNFAIKNLDPQSFSQHSFFANFRKFIAQSAYRARLC